MNDLVREKDTPEKVLSDIRELHALISSYVFEVSYYLDRIKILSSDGQAEQEKEEMTALFSQVSSCLAEIRYEFKLDVKLQSYFAQLESSLYESKYMLNKLTSRFDEYKESGKLSHKVNCLECYEISKYVEQANTELKHVTGRISNAKKQFVLDAFETTRLKQDLLTFQECMIDPIEEIKIAIQRAKRLNQHQDWIGFLSRFLSPRYNPSILLFIPIILLNIISLIGTILYASTPIVFWFEQLRYIALYLSLCQIGYGIRNLILTRDKSPISYPPATFIMRVAKFIYSEKTYQLTFEPLFADLCHEYCSALQTKEESKAKLIKFRYQLIFLKTAVSIIFAPIKEIIDIFK